MQLWNTTVTPLIKEKVYRRLDGSTFTWFQVTFWKSYTAFDKVLNTREEAKEWIQQVEATLPTVNRLHRKLF